MSKLHEVFLANILYGGRIKSQYLAKSYKLFENNWRIFQRNLQSQVDVYFLPGMGNNRLGVLGLEN